MLSKAQVDSLAEASSDKLEAMRRVLREFRSVLVAYSGGVDSAFVLKVAHEELGDRVLAVTAVSPSLADEERKEAVELASRMGVLHECVASNELARPGYVANAIDRCYFCKSELFDLCEKLRASRGFEVVLDGYNADDKVDHRPGHRAALERSVRSPLAEAGLTKAEVRAWSQRLGLPTWDKPQLACLASRIPYGTPVTAERLTQVGAAERALRGFGLKVFRVRHHGEVARLEVSAEELPRFTEPSFREQVNRALRGCGYLFVAVDLEPFRSGRMNEGKVARSGATPEAPSVSLPVLS